MGFTQICRVNVGDTYQSYSSLRSSKGYIMVDWKDLISKAHNQEDENDRINNATIKEFLSLVKVAFEELKNGLDSKFHVDIIDGIEQDKKVGAVIYKNNKIELAIIYECHTIPRLGYRTKYFHSKEGKFKGPFCLHQKDESWYYIVVYGKMAAKDEILEDIAEALSNPKQTVRLLQYLPEEFSGDIAFLDKYNNKGSSEPEKRKNMTRRIFISHSHKDEPLVNLLVDLLQSSLVGIQSRNIMCTSLPGYKLHPGAPTSTTLKEEIKGCEVLIGVITKNSLNSSYVLFELGAAWLADKHPIGLLGHGKNFNDLPAVLGETNGIKTYERHDLESLIDHLASTLRVAKESTALISSKINNLLNYREPEEEQNQNPQ